METLLERGIPIDAINEYSAVEKGPGRPPHWEMVFWWTRKPLAGGRAVVAASLLPADAYQTPEQFLNDLFSCRHSRKTVHACNPASRLVEKIRGKKVLDPFAGFGSIPLEAARLGAEAVAVELLPTAYVFLKAVLEFPRRVKPQDVERWGRWVVERLREEVEGLYDADIYIGTWEVKCLVCGRYTPLVGNWWLARVKGRESYERLAWMEWRDGRVEIRDLNEECRKEGGGSCNQLRAEVSARGEEGGSVVWRGRRYAVPLKNIDARRETAQCLYCRAEINHRVVNGKLVKGKKSEGDWYVKWALRQWNANYERYLKGEIALDDLKNSPARPTLLAKVHIENGDLKFQPATPQDAEKLWKAAEELRKMWGDPDIPNEQMPTYENRRLTPILGATKWYQLFNPRQLLVLVKLVKLIRLVGRLAEEEKLREGASGEEAKKYAKAVTTCLAIALTKLVDYNSLASRWNSSLIMANSLSMRGIAMIWNWYEPKLDINWTGAYLRNILGVAEAVEYLSQTPGAVRVVLDDAAELSRVEGERFDVVVTDPPYADDVPYAELSDFYYVWLKRALSGVEGGELRPRFLPEAFFDEFGLEIPTQWQRFAPREVSENEGRWEHFGMKVTFADLLSRAFSNVVRFLKEDGLLVVYYVAKRPESWEALVDALWRRGGMTLTAAYPVETEAE
ncbi:MAG: DNA methylase, partial [Pyrobaculum sp. OCT_11]